MEKDLKKLTHTKIGVLGENITARKLTSLGYEVIARNYRKRYGEIDIVCTRKLMPGNSDGVGSVSDKEYCFVEVKSRLLQKGKGVKKSSFRLEDNVHELKLAKLRKVVKSFVAEKRIEEGSLHFMVSLVEIGENGRCTLRFLNKLPL